MGVPRSVPLLRLSSQSYQALHRHIVTQRLFVCGAPDGTAGYGAMAREPL